MGLTKKDLHVIAVVSNPIRYKSRYDLYHRFAEKMHKQCVNLYTVECQFGERDFAVTNNSDPKHLQLVTLNEVWHKENMINLGINRLPRDWKYVAWVDADIVFDRDDWVEETLHALQHYEVVQLFQNAIDLAPDGSVVQLHHGFMWQYLRGAPFNAKYYPFWHPGFAWAATRDAINSMGGGLPERCILGSADHHAALALIGKAYASIPNNVSESYRRYIYDWQDRVIRNIKKDVGYVPGTIKHLWHGKKKTRFYQERWGILQKHKFCPYKDLKRDWQGLLQLEDHLVDLRDDIRAYFRARLEDSIDLE